MSGCGPLLPFPGWQLRWFVLEGGCLSYYLSPSEVHLGSRGALKVSSCDITGEPRPLGHSTSCDLKGVIISHMGMHEDCSN